MIAAGMLGASPTPALAATPPSLGQAASFAVLSAAPAAGGAVSCTNGTITGDVGSTGGAASVVQTPCTIMGSIIAPVSAQVVTDFNTAYAAYAAIPCDSVLTGTQAGVTLTPGVYCFTAAATLTGTLTLNGPSTGTWIFKIGTGGTGALSGTGFTVSMAGGGLPCNVSWQVAQAATMTDSNFIGTILAGADLTLTRGTFTGNALATAGWTTTGTTLTGCPPPPPPGVIAISKTADAASVSAGTPIGFTVTVSNTGGSTANGVTLTDAMPGGNVPTPVHWSIDGSTGNPAAFGISGADGSQALSLAGQPISLAAGASLSVHITAPTNAQNCAAYNNTASVTTSDSGSSSSPASETVLCASIAITKTPDAATVNSGDLIGFTILVGNPGTGTTDGVTVTDPLPAGSGSGLTWSIDSQSNPGLCSLSGSKPTQVLSCGPTTLASGDTFSVHITATTSAGECTLYANTASVTTTNDGSGVSTATITCHPANVTITKTPDAATVNSGDLIGFTILVGNPGTGTADGVTVNDPLPAGSGSGLTWSIDIQSNAGLCSINSATAPQTLSCGPTTLASGATFSVHITATTSAGECTVYANTASVTTTNDGSGASTATITCHPANVTITKTRDAAVVNAGDPIGFTILVGNPGTGTADGVTVNDPLPAGSGSGLTWSIDIQSNAGLCSINSATAPQTVSCGPTTLASGAIFSVHITATTSAGECTVYANTASVTTTNDGSGVNSATITCHLANVTLLKTADAASVSAGTPIGFTVTLNVTGSGTATGITLTDALPGGNVPTPVHWSIDGSTGNPAAFSITGVDGSQALSLAGQPISLAAGAALTVHVTATTTAQNCAVYSNTAGVTTSNAGSSSATASATVLCASITLTKTADATSVNASDPIGFTVVVANPGAGTANGVTVSDPLPAGSGSGLSWSISSQSNAGLCSINSATPPQTLSCGPTSLASLATFSVHITATTSAGECTLYANTASVTTTNDGSGRRTATITCNAADPILPGLPNTSAPDVSLGGAIPDAPMRIPDLALTILAGLGMLLAASVGLRRNHFRVAPRSSTSNQRHHPALLAVAMLAIGLSLAPTSLSIGQLAAQPAVALAPGTQLIGSKAVSVVPPARPAAEIFHTVTGPIIPSRLRIPSIGVDAAVGAVGLRADGSMDVPDNLWTSSWWAAGSRPGQAGNAVIAGHRGVGTPALFSHLENVKPGDWIYISDGAGDEMIYVVTRVASLDLSNSTRVAVFENGPSSQLVLITCFGAYIANARTYDHRLVVFGAIRT